MMLPQIKHFLSNNYEGSLNTYLIFYSPIPKAWGVHIKEGEGIIASGNHDDGSKFQKS